MLLVSEFNININNKILYEGYSKHKERNKSSQKILITKFLNNSSNSMIKGKSLSNKSKPRNNENNFKSPYIQKDASKHISKDNYMSNKNKIVCPNPDCVNSKEFLKLYK